MKARRWWLAVGMVGAVAACGADSDEQQAADPGAADATADTARPTPEETAEAEPPPPAPETMAVRTGADDTAAAAAERTAEEETAEPDEPAAPRYDRLFTVQIAAYLDSADAERLAGLLRARGLPLWTTRTTVDGTEWTRVRVGALPGLREARELGSWITREYDSPVWVAPVDQATEPVPTDAVERTRELLGGG
ncbi:MAG: SPOR domain-containing protein [Gemmatimonadota bacterium]